MHGPRSTSDSYRSGPQIEKSAATVRSVELDLEQAPQRRTVTHSERNHGSRLADSFNGALLGAALGDALGALVERAGPDDPVAPILSQPSAELRFGAPTLMTLATTQSLVERKGFDASHVMLSLAAHFEREPWRVLGLDSPQQFDSAGLPRRWEQAAASLYGGDAAYGNDAAARVTPVGLFFHAAPARAAEAARSTAFTTHAHPIGQDGAGMHAAAVAEIVRAGGFDGNREAIRGMLSRIRETAGTRRFRDLIDYLLVARVRPSDVIRLLGNGKEAHRSVTTALYAFVSHPLSFTDGLSFALSLRGASRALGTMTGALCGAAVGAMGIPADWRARLERADELLQTAEQLLAVCLAEQSAAFGDE